MEIAYLADWREPAPESRPVLILRRDRWDDFGYKTSFAAELWLADQPAISLGQVKIMQRGQGASSSTLPLPRLIDELSDDFHSVGQDMSYYEEMLERLPREECLDALRRLRDLALDPTPVEELRASEPAFTTSLLRFNSAERVLIDAPSLLASGTTDTQLTFSFTTHAGGGEEFTANFTLGDQEDLPSRMAAVIGYNGSGKTSLLANMAIVAWQASSGRREVRESNGYFTPFDVPFSRVIAVSYSAFDTFTRPKSRERAKEYVYCGLRVEKDDYQLKSMSEVAEELAGSLELLKAADRWLALEAALQPLLQEPSFQLSSTVLDFRDASWRATFDALSTGHKISLNILVQLVAHLQTKSLVLLDEPESHLHPPLLAALMKGIGIALHEGQSFAVVATHSPVVLQEIAQRYVQVLRRTGTRAQIEVPTTETFGENVGTLTRAVFHLDNSESDFEGVLKALVRKYEDDEALDIFPLGPSAQAAALMMRYRYQMENED